MKKLKCNPPMSFVVGMIIGIVVFLIIYGFDVVRFTNVNWLTHSDDLEGIWDLTQHYMGWEFYRNSPWRFPIGLMDGVVYEPISVAYTDSIPLFAIIFKLMSPILPESFQYFGLFQLMSYALMGGFGSLIVNKYNKNIVFNAIVSVLFVLSPILTKRALYHTALSAHFLILIAICLWIYRESITNYWKYSLLWVLLCVISTLTNPYYVPMVVGILLCSVLQDMIANKRIIKSILCVVCSGVAILIASYVIGLFYGQVSASTVGLDMLSSNLNTLYNPRDLRLSIPEPFNYQFEEVLYSSILPGLDYGEYFQEEGFAYLGIGMLILSFTTIIYFIIILIIKMIRKEISRREISIVVSVLLGFLAFISLSLGPICYFNSYELYSIKWPDAIYRMLCIFRSEGRFIWPVHLGIMTISFIGLSKMIRKESLLIVTIVIFLIIQVVDLWPAVKNKHDIYSKIGYSDSKIFSDSELNNEFWEEIGKKTNEIVFYSPTELTISGWPKYSCLFELLAIRHNIKLSATYCSRPIHEAANKYAEEELINRKNGKRDCSQVFVFMIEENMPSLKDTGLHLYLVENMWVGTEQYINGFNMVE